MTKVRVLYLAPFPSAGRFAGGITAVANGLRRHLDVAEAHGCELEFLNTEPGRRDTAGAGKLRLENVRSALQLMWRVRQACKGGRYDVLNISSSKSFALLKDLLVAWFADLSFGGRIVLHIHSAEAKRILTGNRLFDALALRLMRRHVDDVIFLSRSTRDEFVSLGLSRERTHVLYNFHALEVDRAFATRKSEAVLGKGVLDLVFLGSLDRKKGVLELLKAAASIGRGRFRLHLCGTPNDPTIEGEMAPFLAELGDTVLRHGYVSGSEKLRILATADVLVLPSHTEGLPVALLEAMANGCALVATHVGAIPEIVSDDRDALLAPPGDERSLAACLRRLIDDRALCARLMRASAGKAPLFTAERFVSELCDVLARRVPTGPAWNT